MELVLDTNQTHGQHHWYRHAVLQASEILTKVYTSDHCSCFYCNNIKKDTTLYQKTAVHPLNMDNIVPLLLRIRKNIQLCNISTAPNTSLHSTTIALLNRLSFTASRSHKAYVENLTISMSILTPYYNYANCRCMECALYFRERYKTYAPTITT